MATIPLTATGVVFGIGLLAGVILLGGLVVSLVSPSRRFWPHGDPDWTFWVSWTSWILYFGGLLGTAYLDWRRSFDPSTLVQSGALLLVVAGGGLATWAALHLGLRESSGLEGDLDTGGPYRWSRNPQYVGYVAMLVGWAVLPGSWLTSVLTVPGIAWFLLAPFAEEPWLRDKYGEDYEAYAESVPRFVGRSRQRTSRRQPPDRSDGGGR